MSKKKKTFMTLAALAVAGLFSFGYKVNANRLAEQRRSI